MASLGTSQGAPMVVTRIQRVSVVVPTFNRSGLLASCLKSLDDQDFEKAAYEVIVVDDGSTDETPEALEAFRRASNINIVCLRGSHRGPAAARNTGIARSRGDIVAFIDDDCQAQRAWLRNLVSALQSGKVDGAEGKVVRHPECTPFTHFVENLGGGLFLTANMAFKREALMATGGFDETYAHAAAEDWDLAFRILEDGGRLVFCPGAVVVHAPVPIRGRDIVERVKERRSAVLLYKRFPEMWERTTGRTMKRSFAEGIFMGPVVEFRKWRRYFIAHFAEAPRFLFWQLMASARLLVEYVRLRAVGLV